MWALEAAVCMVSTAEDCSCSHKKAQKEGDKDFTVKEFRHERSLVSIDGVLRGQ